MFHCFHNAQKPANFPLILADLKMEYWLKFGFERKTIVKEVYFYIAEMIPKHNAQHINRCIEKYICCAPNREGGGGCRKKTNDEPEINDAMENRYENEIDESDQSLKKKRR